MSPIHNRRRTSSLLLAVGAFTLIAIPGCSSQTAARSDYANDSATEQSSASTSTQQSTFTENTPANHNRAAQTASANNNPRFNPYGIDAQVERGRDSSLRTWTRGAPSGQFAQIVDDEQPGVPRENPDAITGETLENLSQLTFSQEGSDFDPSISRDGKFLVFASTQHRPTPEIYIKPVGGRTVTQLTADTSSNVMPTISPDGKKIAFASNRSGFWNIYVMSAAGGQAVQLTTQQAHELHPTWSPDGRHIAFCRLGQMSGRWEVWVMDANQPQSTEFIAYGLFPQWNPVVSSAGDGGEKILFQRGRDRGDRAFSLWTVDYKPGEASSPTEVVSIRGQAAINATWSPDGQWIAYSTVPAESAASGARPVFADMWITRIDGTGRVNLTAGRFLNVMPVWGSDNRIYFVSDRGGIDNVWSVSTNKALAAAGANTQPQAKSEDVASAPTTP